MSKNIVQLIGKPAMYELLAEECCELAKESLKMARILRGDNPTPRTEGEVWDNIVEERTDVEWCIQLLGIEHDPGLMEEKEKRFFERWKEAHEEENIPEESFPYVLGQSAEIFTEGEWVRGKIVEGYRFRDGIVTIETDEGNHIWCGADRTDIYQPVKKERIK